MKNQSLHIRSLLTPLTTAFLLALVIMFGLTSVAEAASISSRVRILESKVKKHSKEIRSIKRQQRLQAQQINKGLADYKEFKEEMVQMIADLNKKSKKKYHYPEPYTGYAYP